MPLNKLSQTKSAAHIINLRNPFARVGFDKVMLTVFDGV